MTEKIKMRTKLYLRIIVFPILITLAVFSFLLFPSPNVLACDPYVDTPCTIYEDVDCGNGTFCQNQTSTVTVTDPPNSWVHYDGSCCASSGTNRCCITTWWEGVLLPGSIDPSSCCGDVGSANALCYDPRFGQCCTYGTPTSVDICTASEVCTDCGCISNTSTRTCCGSPSYQFCPPVLAPARTECSPCGCIDPGEEKCCVSGETKTICDDEATCCDDGGCAAPGGCCLDEAQCNSGICCDIATKSCHEDGIVSSCCDNGVAFCGYCCSPGQTCEECSADTQCCTPGLCGSIHGVVLPPGMSCVSCGAQIYGFLFCNNPCGCPYYPFWNDDQDNDGIPDDQDPYPDDQDNDGIPDDQDLDDQDNDGIPDDQDPYPDDQDNDGIPDDQDPYPDDQDNDGIPDDQDLDDDNDGILDGQEPDNDNDGIPDDQDPFPYDWDNDGIPDTTCNNNKRCVPGGGGNICFSDSDCQSQKTCSINRICVLNGGGETCSEDSECTDLDMQCNSDEKCVPGGGGASCSTDSYCESQTKGCSIYKTCVPGGGGGICSSDDECLEVDGACGTAVRIFENSEIFPGSFTYCSSGILLFPYPLNPLPGGSSVWICGGQYGGLDSGTCTATRVTGVVYGVCGPAAKTYASSETFPGGAYCSAGTPSPASPTNPSIGSPSEWTCLSPNGGSSSGTCTATRVTGVVDGVCGPAAKTYASSETFPGGAYCSAGTPSPASPTNPSIGSPSEWTCLSPNGGSSSGTCTATRVTGVVDGVCGPAAKTYAYSEPFLSGFYCSSGIIPSVCDNSANCNPPIGGSSTWTCDSDICTAERNIPAGSVRCTAYLLENVPPEVTAMVTSSDYCLTSETGVISFGWTYQDADLNNEKGFELQVSQNSSFSSIDFSASSDSLDYPSGTTISQYTYAYVKISPNLNELAYDTTYYWRVRVFDDYGLDSGLDSGWVEYYDPSDADGDGNPETFTTSLHPWPSVVFSPSPPLAPFVDNKATFTFIDLSQCYDEIITGQSCSDPTETTTYLWTFGDGETSTEKGTVSHDYDALGTYSVNLEVCDAHNYCCDTTQSVKVRTPTNVPEWKEISPF